MELRDDTWTPMRADRRARRLSVLSVAYPLAPVSTDSVGGAEQILAAIDAALVAAGHRSLVIACRGSRVRGELIELPTGGERLTHDAWCAAHAACRAAIDRVLAETSIDIVHMHGIDFHTYLPAPGPCVLVTLHLPLAWYPPHALRVDRPGTFLQCVSRTQCAAAPAGVRLLPAIENGVDLDRLRPEAQAGGYALTLGRICPEKAQHVALEAAARAGVPLVIAGKVFGFPEHEAYFATAIAPRLASPHRFVGVVAGDAKARLIAGARCVVVPSVVDETSALVAMEALACGTPVVAFRRGALVELLESGRTGALVDDVAAMARAIAGADRFDRARCRAVAEARCDGRRMCERYLARYAELAPSREGGPRGKDRAILADSDRAVMVFRSGPPRARSAQLRVEVVGAAGLALLEPAWHALWERDARATVFQRPQWCVPWCRWLLRGTVEALAVWRGRDLEALLPLVRWRDGAADVLSLIGAGVTDYLDVLIAPGADDARRALERAVATRAWARLELGELRADSPLLQLEIAGRDERSAGDTCPALALRADLPLAAATASIRREVAYQRRRAARELGVEVAPLPAGALVDALAVLHGARWAARGETGVLDDARRAFLRDAAVRLAGCDAVLGVGIRFGGELAAVALAFVDRGAARYYLGGFDPAHQRRSPGTLAVAALIEEASRRELPVFDFLRGDEPYKYRFGATDQVRLYRRVVQRR